MKRIGIFIGFLAVLVFLLPSLPAQDEKKDTEKSAKKEDDKKDPEKKDDPEKKPAKEKKEAEKMPPYSTKFRTKILSANAATAREFTIETYEVDPKKVADVQTWQAQRSTQLQQQLAQISTQKDAKARLSQMQNYQKDLYNFQMELAKRSSDIYKTKALEVRAHDDAKVRTMFLPVLFDDQGNPKKWTEKEKAEFRGHTKIPGYPADFDAIKSGQYVDIYMAKKPPSPKKDPDQPKKKKGDDDPPAAMERAEFILIVIYGEPEKK